MASESDESYPQNYGDAPGPADPSRFSDLYPDQSLLRHEWRPRHMLGLSPDAFFSTARAAFKSFTVPRKLARLTAQISLPPGPDYFSRDQSDPSIGTNGLALSCRG